MKSKSELPHPEPQGKVIPVLPCPDIHKQTAFFEQLGFTLLGKYRSPNAYAILRFGNIELHFYGNKKLVPAQNPSMCYIKIKDVDELYHSFVSAIKCHTGKVPRSGIPRISKIRDLKEDRRFTLTDTGGNTYYIGTPVKVKEGNFFRTLASEKFAKQFSLLYDLVYSKEDFLLAASRLSFFLESKDLLSDLDKAKFLLVMLDIQKQLELPVDDTELQTVIENQKEGGRDWEKVRKKYEEILSGE
ncbi:hypothetical protein AAG747_04980 [Rapidithrix thailandica]|uniref:DUF4304 domain-containing protein n=1 Tax=Rapidithrix thailandica TaxID=413964 RepID=A0AAW9S6A7_9BACT